MSAIFDGVHGLRDDRVKSALPVAAGDSASMVLRFGDDWQIVVPTSIRLLTPYVLLEQERWFESEMEFLSKWLRPGMRVIDVGANYGVYTVAMAQRIGSSGALWAFEPGRQAFDLLSQTVVHNRFDQAVVIKAALGADFGNVRLLSGDNTELNQITSDDHDANTELVDLTTLDHCAQELAFGDIDLIKLDAEGYEVQVVSGASRLLRRCSPLVMFEFKHNDDFNYDLLQAFQALGYSIYVLIPGIGALVPYCQTLHDDPLLINLFACNEARAQSLRRQGYLLDAVPPTGDRAATELARLGLEPANATARVQPSRPGRRADTAEDARIEATCLTLAAERVDLDPAVRLQAALSAFDLCAKSSPQCTWSLAIRARLAAYLGKRAAAAKLSSSMLPGLRLRRHEPAPGVLPAWRRYDAIEPDDNRYDWFAAAAHECFEHCRAYSSYMLGVGCLANIEAIETLGYLTAEFERRRQLILRNVDDMPSPAVPALLCQSEYNLNREFWQRQQLVDLSNDGSATTYDASANGATLR